MSTSYSNKWQSSWVMPLATSLLLIVVMYGLVPYTFRYNVQEPISIFHMLWLFWTGIEQWQHCGLVIPICLGLIYWRRADYFQIPVRGDNRAWPLFFVAFLFYWVGYKGDIKPLAFASLQILLAALVLWHLGWPMLRALLFPWLFLLFVWPLPGLDDDISFKLRIFMSSITYHFLNLIGIPAIRSGTAVISAPDFAANIQQGARFQLDVADPCSGIRSLFALTMVTALYAYIALGKTWQKIILFLCAIPLAVFGNFIRMLMLTFGCILLGSDIAIGPPEKPSFYHEMAGFAVFGAAIVGMLVVAWLLELDWKRLLLDFKKRMTTPASTGEKTP